MKKRKIKLKNPHAGNLVELILRLDNRTPWEVFSDFVYMAAIAIANSFDPIMFQEREKRYLNIKDKYSSHAQDQFPYMFEQLHQALNLEYKLGEYNDVLGLVLTALGVYDKHAGQFFSNQPVADLMAQMLECTPIDEKNKDFVTLSEPACGGGSLIYATVKNMAKQGINYSKRLCVSASDIDYRCVAMTYCQMALYGIPGVVIEADVLKVKERERWYTPVYLIKDWLFRCRCGLTNSYYLHDELLKRAYYPLLGIVREMNDESDIPKIWLSKERGA